MSIVSSFNEWDPLEEVIVGRVEGARVPCPNRDLHCIEFWGQGEQEQIPSGPWTPRIIEETAEDLETLAATLERLGIIVHRPEPLDPARRFSSPHWESDGQYNYCPRDSMLVIGDTILETPMVLRARQYETFAYRSLLTSYFRQGARWLAAPRPRLLDSVYRVPSGFSLAIDESEPLFDAANVARCGRDLFYLISDSGNHLGAQWLAQALGPTYRVHRLAHLRNTIHIDTTLVFIRPGLLLAAGQYVTPDNLPAPLRSWRVIYFEDIVDVDHPGPYGASKWVGMNLLMIKPSLAIVDRRQEPLIRTLEKHGVDVIPLLLRHGRTLGGGFHCVTLDIRRRGTLEDYCN
jgi:N-dimethylarginine dimethylaminohydrolase